MGKIKLLAIQWRFEALKLCNILLSKDNSLTLYMSKFNMKLFVEI